MVRVCSPISIDRPVFLDRKLLVENCSDIQLHKFCDVNNVGYGAFFMYARMGKKDTVAKLLCAKSQVAL